MSLYPLPPTPRQWPFGVWRGWNKWMYLLPWGNKSAPCGVVAIGKRSLLGLLEAVSLDLWFDFPLTCFFYWVIPKNIHTMPRTAFQNSEGKVGVLWTGRLCFLLREKLSHGVCSFILLHLCPVHEENAPNWVYLRTLLGIPKGLTKKKIQTGGGLMIM